VRLQHVSIVVPPASHAEARSFYGELLGLEERDVLPDLDPSRYIWYRTGRDTELHLMISNEPPPVSPHLCLAVDDLDEVRDRLEAAGVETREGTRVEGRARFTCRDPFGNLVELARVE
jgi:catechol 2,3-dioxygenase-like lactoylglutathione lyase family enzyme